MPWGKQAVQVQHLILTMFKLWSYPKIELDEHNLCLCCCLCIIYTHTSTHFMERLSAYAENRARNSAFQWTTPGLAEAKAKAGSLGLRSLQQTGDPNEVSAPQHSSWAREGCIVSAAQILRPLSGGTRTKTEFSLEQQHWVDSYRQERHMASCGTRSWFTISPIQIWNEHRMSLLQTGHPCMQHPCNFILTTHKLPLRQCNVIIVSGKGIF